MQTSSREDTALESSRVRSQSCQNRVEVLQSPWGESAIEESWGQSQHLPRPAPPGSAQHRQEGFSQHMSSGVMPKCSKVPSRMAVRKPPRLQLPPLPTQSTISRHAPRSSSKRELERITCSTLIYLGGSSALHAISPLRNSSLTATMKRKYFSTLGLLDVAIVACVGVHSDTS